MINMNNWKKKVLVLVFMLAFALALTACGSGDDVLEGTYVVEGDETSGLTMTFTGDRFTFVLPYSEIEMDFNLPGSFTFSGTFTVDNSSRLINFNIDEAALRDAVEDMVDLLIDYLFMGDPELVEAMEDPEFAEMMMGMLDEMMDGMYDELLDGMMDEIGELTLRFDRRSGFDRLYDDEADMVFVRR